ncbi:MAG: hypothetical protein H7A42_04300 [Chlamydiales bacterium]|nr:hypothetical protein [Chlamydiales bacterium]
MAHRKRILPSSRKHRPPDGPAKRSSAKFCDRGISPYNSWLGRPSKEADYVTVTLNGVESTFPNRKYAEDYVQQMQRQQRLVHQGNNQSYESQQQALYLGKSPQKFHQLKPNKNNLIVNTTLKQATSKSMLIVDLLHPFKKKG